MTEHTTIQTPEPKPSPSASRENQGPPPDPPAEFIELRELRGTSVEHALGYFRGEPAVIFSYCPGGSEVLWRDGHSAGFGTGGWRFFLWEIVPLAARHGAVMGDEASIGTHVLVVDRARNIAYAAPRAAAEHYLTAIHGHRARAADLDCTAGSRWHT